METLFSAVHCLECGHEMEADLYLTQCHKCGSEWLDAVYKAIPREWPQELLQRPTSFWRYSELLPFPSNLPAISMGEGWTPLIRAKRLAQELGLTNLWIKDERQQPTGSFKDRQAAATVSALAAHGIDEMVLASTGNAAAAYAAYCARADIKLWVFLTSSVPAEKMRELALYGAEVIKITGTYDQAKKIAANFAKRRGVLYDLGAKAIPGKESMKTIAFEIAEQLNWQAPDWYIQAVSGGIGPLGVHKGFLQLYQAGLIDRIPKLGIIQSAGCAPMVQAWENGLDEATPVEPDTLITVLATGDPGYSYKILKHALDVNGGAMIGVSDGEAFRAMRRLARVEGLSVEPASSVAFAGLEKLIAAGYIGSDDKVVINCSGHTFSAEKHALEDRYILHLEVEKQGVSEAKRTIPRQAMDSEGLRQASGEQKLGIHHEGLSAALIQLDEQITTIVIIDDNPHDSRLIRRLLQSYKNYRVFEAHNGPDGIDLVRQRQPQLVVLDLTLPDMDGFTILAALKADERTRNIPVIIISAKALTASELKQLRRHTDSVWQKGNFRPQELLQHVVERLRGGETSESNESVSAPREHNETIEAKRTDKNSPHFGHLKREQLGESENMSANTPLSDSDRESVETTKQTSNQTINQTASRVELAWADTLEQPPQRPRILVVDDNRLDARLMRRLLEARQRFEVIEAYSMREGLAAILKAVPDLIILDLLLPDGHGQKLLEELRQREETRNIPIIVVSAQTLEAGSRAKLAALADSIWEKGIMDRNSLLAHIETILTG